MGQKILEKTATGADRVVNNSVPNTTFQAHGATTDGAGAAVIAIQANNISADAANALWVTLGTISLTLSTTQATDGFSVNASWDFVRANVTSISGTGASVSDYMGEKAS